MEQKKRTLRKNSSPSKLVEFPEKRSKKKTAQLTRSQQEAKLLGFDAINLVRKGKAKSLTDAARTVGTNVRSIRRLLPGALAGRGPDGRIRVKAGDTYSARVEITTTSGRLKVTAHGSRERDLAGLYSSTIYQVLDRKAPPSALRQFRGKKIAGQKLISTLTQLQRVARAGEIGQLEALYVSPEVSS
jgi:hypothetical protein